jgi:hypothetical protein
MNRPVRGCFQFEQFTWKALNWTALTVHASPVIRRDVLAFGRTAHSVEKSKERALAFRGARSFTVCPSITACTAEICEALPPCPQVLALLSGDER